jgi:leucyl aminopeptidase (aminopeptidase T)
MAALAARRNVRVFEVGNGLYPTPARAALFGLDQNELARQFWTAVNADAAQLSAAGARVRDRLAAAREVRVTHPNGTDVRFGLDTRQVFVNDGNLSDADVAAGGNSLWKWLPAGEVYARVASPSASGRVVVDQYNYQGSLVSGLTIELQGGRINAISATAGGEAFLAAYNNAAGDGRDLLSVFDIGINPGLQATPGSRVLNFVPAGMVTLFFGANPWAGGDNHAAFSIEAFIPGTTVALDGQVIVENGSLRP